MSLMWRKIISALFVIFLITPNSTSAQGIVDSGLRLTTSPLPLHLITEPGQPVSTELRIKNSGSEFETLRVGVMKFTAGDDTGRPKLADPLPTDEFVQWVSFSESQFGIAPNEWKTITATFTPPPQAAFGYYYAITFSRAQERLSTDSSTAIVGAAATLVLLEVRVPNAHREVEVTEFSTDRSWYEFLPAQFNIRLHNSGNVHLSPRGNIFLSRSGSEDIAILEVNESSGSILPDSSRLFTTQWTDGFPVYIPKKDEEKIAVDEEGKPIQKLTWDFSQADKLRWGKYTATLLLIYDDGQRDIPLEGTVSFWVIPWKMLIALFVFILFIGIGVYTTCRRIFRALFRKRAQRMT